VPEGRLAIHHGMDTSGEKKKRTFKKNVDGRITSIHDNMNFRTRSVEKQGGMAFDFITAIAAVIKPDGWIDGYIYISIDR
jgi:hypothetical protein